MANLLKRRAIAFIVVSGRALSGLPALTLHPRENGRVFGGDGSSIFCSSGAGGKTVMWNVQIVERAYWDVVNGGIIISMIEFVNVKILELGELLDSKGVAEA